MYHLISLCDYDTSDIHNKLRHFLSCFQHTTVSHLSCIVSTSVLLLYQKHTQNKFDRSIAFISYLSTWKRSQTHTHTHTHTHTRRQAGRQTGRQAGIQTNVLGNFIIWIIVWISLLFLVICLLLWYYIYIYIYI